MTLQNYTALLRKDTSLPFWLPVAIKLVFQQKIMAQIKSYRNRCQPLHCTCEWCCNEEPLNSPFHLWDPWSLDPFLLLKAVKLQPLTPVLVLAYCIYIALPTVFHDIRCFSQAMSDEDTYRELYSTSVDDFLGWMCISLIAEVSAPQMVFYI